MPKIPRRDGLALLVDQAAIEAAVHGSARCPAGPCLAAARVLLVTRQSWGWDLSTSSQEVVEGKLRAVGLTWAWEAEDLVLEIPGWTPPPPVIVMVQPGLFE